jgi:hypothetical protein
MIATIMAMKVRIQIYPESFFVTLRELVVMMFIIYVIS